MHDLGLLPKLLEDKTTRKRIIWATDTYQHFGAGFGRRDEISPERLLEHDLLETRRGKRGERTRRHGEVFTPLRVCEKMCAHAHNILQCNDWQKYVPANVLEICCGEAPFLVSRRDLAKDSFVPVRQRVGLLDRKLQAVNENVTEESEWLEWVYKAFQATYGYEFQGDNLFLARINLLRTFEEYLRERWERKPSSEEYDKILNIIVWNIWQMDGLTGTVPFGRLRRKFQILSLLDTPKKDDGESPPCVIFDWNTGKAVEYLSLAGVRK